MRAFKLGTIGVCKLPGVKAKSSEKFTFYEVNFKWLGPKEKIVQNQKFWYFWNQLIKNFQKTFGPL